MGSERGKEMIDGLIAGKVYGQPQSRTDSRGRVFALGKIRAATAAGESLFVSCIVFGDAASQFLALGDGDPVAAAGSITPKTWTDREGLAHPALDMQVQQVLTMYHLRKKRQRVQGDDGHQQDGGQHGNYLPNSGGQWPDDGDQWNP